MKLTRKITSIGLSILLVSSAAAVSSFSASAASVSSQLAQDTVEGGAILHCFDWSYNSIKENLAAIAEAGYTAVQTSPVQQPKDYSASYTDQSGQWWKLYQPLGLSIADGTTWLGTKAELQALCEAADDYGIKVIVDIVANHLANNGSDGGGFSYVNSGIESDLYNFDYFHSTNTYTSDSNRYTITQYHLGMPDLNTSNSYVQSRVLGLLEECVDLGVDGFRFDAAKHIELPTDTSSNCASDFWPTVINGIKEYAGDDIYLYGEILNYAGTDISNYTTYIDVKGLFVKPVQPVGFRIAHSVCVPDRAEITADNHNIVLCHLALFGKCSGRKLLKLAVAIACYKNHNIVTPNFLASLISCCV